MVRKYRLHLNHSAAPETSLRIANCNKLIKKKKEFHECVSIFSPFKKKIIYSLKNISFHFTSTTRKHETSKAI